MRLIAIVLAAATLCTCGGRQDLHLPGLMLWAWQRSEDLRFIDIRTTGVAYLAGTAGVTAHGEATFEPRLQPLKVPAGASMLAVVRLEGVPPGGERALIQNIQQVVRAPGVRGLQIDFDATLSQRVFYQRLLRQLRSELPVPVGVTALASWCDGDRWLDEAHVVEAVPMFFRMGKQETRNMQIA